MNDPKGRNADARDLLRRYDLHPKRSLSQNFLVQPDAAARIANAAAELGREVVEIGPGLGALTGALLDLGCEVTAVELDRDMLHVLKLEYPDEPSLALVHGDAAKYDLGAHAEARGSKLVVTGNLPYQATGAILRQSIEQRAYLFGAVFMVQREVRDRLAATPGNKDYGALTVFTQAAFVVEPLFRLRPGSFYPAPKVDSAVVRFVPRDTELAAQTDAFAAVVRAAFHTRRKTLRNALRALGDEGRAGRALAHAEIDPSRRGETLSIAEFASLAEHWEAEG